MGNWFGREDTDKVIEEMIEERHSKEVYREGYILCQALDCAIETLRKAEYPECSNIADMILVREQRFGTYEDVPSFAPEAQKKVLEKLLADAAIDRPTAVNGHANEERR